MKGTYICSFFLDDMSDGGLTILFCRIEQIRREISYNFSTPEVSAVLTPILFLAAKRSSTRALVLCPSVRPSVRFKTEFLTVWSAYDNL